MGAEEDLAAQLKAAESEAEKWKELARKHETRSKDNAAAAEELKTLKASSLSEQQRREAAEKDATKKLEDLERKIAESDARALRAEVAAAKGLTPAQAKRLAGTTREELEADADELVETFKSTDTGDGSGTERKPRPASRPKTDVSGGGDPNEEAAVETNPAKLAESVPRY